MNQYFYQKGLPYRQNDQLIQNIAKAINGEYSAIQCYGKLAQLAPNVKEREQILEIRQDEAKHFKDFSQIYVNLTGQQPSVKVSEECPDNYKEGLEFSIIDEQETVDLYLDIADETNNPYIKRAFKRAAADEQNHAVWFLYYFTKYR